MLPELTKGILDAKRFDSQSDAEAAARVLRVELLGTEPEAEAFVLDDRKIHVVYAGNGEYLKAFR